MPLHTDNDFDARELLTGSLAESAVTTSLAAGAAALLAEDPEKPLRGRLKGALEAHRDWLTELIDTKHEKALLELFTTQGPAADQAERLFAKLAPVKETQGEELAAALRDYARELVASLDVLLTDPTEDAARFALEYLDNLSTAQAQRVHQLQSERTDTELAVFARAST